MKVNSLPSDYVVIVACREPTDDTPKNPVGKRNIKDNPHITGVTPVSSLLCKDWTERARHRQSSRTTTSFESQKY